MSTADAVRADIESLRFADDKPFRLLAWQSQALEDFLQPSVRIGGLSMGRGNGKSAFAAALAVSALTGALAQPKGEVFIVASSLPQGRIIFGDVRTFLEPMVEAEPGRFRIVDNHQLSQIKDRATDSELRVLSSDSRRAHGLRPSFWLLDELSEWPPQGERMLTAAVTGMGKRPSRMLGISTRGDTDDDLFARYLRMCDWERVHSAELTDDPLDLESYRAANPSLAAMPELEAAIVAEIEMARREPMLLQMLRSRRLNLATPDTAESFLLSAENYLALEGEAETVGSPSIIGFDLGSGAAMSCAVAVWPNGVVRSVGAFPSDPTLTERGRLDGVGDLYLRMHDAGELLLIGDRVVDLNELIDDAVSRWGAPDVVVADRWRQAELEQALTAVGVRRGELRARGMGWKDGSEDVRLFREAALGGGITVEPSLLLRSAMREARVVADPAGNEKLGINSEGGRRKRARDDGAAAMVLAVAEWQRQRRRPMRTSRSPILAVVGERA